MGYDLPVRTSRGKRAKIVVEDEAEAEADDEFWGQDFFQEEAKDENYATEEEQEDVVDTDFDDTEDESEDDVADEPRDEPRKKRLLPPGTKRKLKTAQKVHHSHMPKAGKETCDNEGPSNGNDGENPEPVEGKMEACGEDKASDGVERQEAPVLRHSTMKRREKAELERQRQEELRNRRKKIEPVHKYKPLTQAELLKEAAQTEIKNIESLQQLVAMEEETKMKALEKRAKYIGPLIRISSKKVDGAERTTMELCHMQNIPEWLQPQSAAPCTKPVCVITGLPAKYRDPSTGLPYSSLDAFKEIQRRSTAE